MKNCNIAKKVTMCRNINLNATGTLQILVKDNGQYCFRSEIPVKLTLREDELLRIVSQRTPYPQRNLKLRKEFAIPLEQIGIIAVQNEQAEEIITATFPDICKKLEKFFCSLVRQ
jgi:hypothetical protein